MGRPERITIEDAQPIVGVKLRSLYGLAARGEIPGAAKIGKRWTFDEVKLRSWLREREAATCRNARHLKTATGVGRKVGKSSGAASRSTGRSTDGLYEHGMRLLQRGA